MSEHHAAGADGTSQSLSLMAQSAAKDRQAELSASAAVDAPTDEARRGNRDQTPQLQSGGEDLILRAK